MATSSIKNFQDYAGRSRHLFWDIDPSTLDPGKHSTFIIERILRFGMPEDIRVMQEQYSDAAVRAVIIRSRHIDRKTAAFWAVHLGIPREEIACFSTPLITSCFY